MFVHGCQTQCSHPAHKHNSSLHMYAYSCAVPSVGILCLVLLHDHADLCNCPLLWTTLESDLDAGQPIVYLCTTPSYVEATCSCQDLLNDTTCSVRCVYTRTALLVHTYVRINCIFCDLCSVHLPLMQANFQIWAEYVGLIQIKVRGFPI